MTSVLAALLGLAAQAVPPIGVELAEDPTPGRKPPAVAVKGSLDAPDGVILHVRLLLENPLGQHEVDHALARVRQGRFACAFECFRGKARNLPGVWTARAEYDPTLQALQPPPFPGRAAGDGVLRLGTPEEIRRAHQEVRDRLLADLKGFREAVLEPARAMEADRAQPDPARWTALRKDLDARTRALRDRGSNDRELKALGLSGIPEQGMDLLISIVVESVDMAKRGDAVTLGQARERLEREVTKMVALVGSLADQPDRGRAMVKRMREALKAVPALAPEARPAARRRYFEAVLELGRLVAPSDAAAVGELSSAGTAYFESLDGPAAESARLLRDLERRLQALDEVLPK
jgi:hypothetical protein